MMKKFKFALPNGSLWERLCIHMKTAGYPLQKPGRNGFCGEFDGIEFYQLDRRMIPRFLKDGGFGAGITGKDLWMESAGIWGERGNEEKKIRIVSDLCFSRSSDVPSRWVLAKRADGRLLPRCAKIACELQNLGQQLLAPHFRTFEIIRIEGSEEQCVANRLADAVLVVTETGKSIRENGLEIVEGFSSLLVSTPQIRAWNNLYKEQDLALERLNLALSLVIGAQNFVMITFDIPASVDLTKLSLQSSVAPTVSPLLLSDWNACQICIPRTVLGDTLLKLKSVGAKGIGMHDLDGYLP